MTFLSFVSKYLDALPDSMREQFLEDIEDLIEFSIRKARKEHTCASQAM